MASIRLYSAVSLFLLFAMVSIYLYQKYGRVATLLFMIIFVSSQDFFFNHMGRNADADAIYILLYTAAFLCMLELEQHPKLLYLCGFFFSLAFLAKSWHAMLLALVGGCFLIASGLWKKYNWKQYLLFVLCAFGPILLWAFIRYQYDGMTFLGQMFRVDVTERAMSTSSKDRNLLFFTSFLLQNKALLIALLWIVVAVVRKRKQLLESFRSKHLLGLLVGILIPYLILSVSNTYLYWYSYPVYIPLMILGVVAGARLLEITGRKKVIIYAMMLASLLVISYNVLYSIRRIDNLEISGFQTDLQTSMEQYPECHGMKIYVERTSNVYKEAEFWEQAGLMMAEVSGDLKCEDGGVNAFVKEPETCLLIVDQVTYDENAGMLKNYKVLYENEYLLLEK